MVVYAAIKKNSLKKWSSNAVWIPAVHYYGKIISKKNLEVKGLIAGNVDPEENFIKYL